MAAFSSKVIFDVRAGGSDTANAGCFDPSQTAGMNTDGAATVATGNSPVFTSASYNFVAGDVNAWLFIASGSNWTPGWYQIASVAANAATLNAALGAYYVLKSNLPVRLSTASQPWVDAAGCATTASPTGATWSIDYSQQAAAQFSYTDIASVGAGLTASSAAKPFGKQHVGNGLIISSGTNFTAGLYILTSVAATVGTFAGAANMTTGAGVNGVGGMGGAFATPGKAASKRVAGDSVFWQANGTTPYNLSTNAANVAGGIVSDTLGGVDQTNVAWWVGWNTNRSTTSADTTWPIINANAQTSVTLLSFTGSYARMRNMVVDGNTKASLTGFNQNNSYQRADHVAAQNCTVIGIDIQGGNNVAGWYLKATGCSGTAGIRVSNSSGGVAYYSESYGNTTHGFQGGAGARLVNCIASGNTGASSDGFNSFSIGFDALNCVAYGNGRDGFNADSSVGIHLFVNCIAEGNAGSGWSTSSVRQLVQLANCAGYNNTSGNFSTANITDVTGFVAGTASFFTAASGGDFSLNSTTGGGAGARSAGVPGLMPRGLTTSYADIGAAQHRDPAKPDSLFVPLAWNL